MTTVGRAAGDRAAPKEVSINSVPISIALVAGGLSVVNPCGFPLLPAFLSFYFGAEEEQLPPASTRLAQGLVVGGLVALGGPAANAKRVSRVLSARTSLARA